MLCGDFFIQPSMVLEEIERNLQGVEAQDEGKIFRIVQEVLRGKKVQTPMLTPDDFAIPLARAAREACRPINLQGIIGSIYKSEI